MVYRIDDSYNQGIGTPDLGNMNVGQVPMNNMQTAGWWPEILGGTSAEQDAENAALEQIQEIRKNQFEGYPSGTNPAWVEEYKGDYPDLYQKYKDKEKQIQDLKKQYPENINIQQASLDDDEYDFSGIEGQTAGLPAAGKLWDIYRALQLAKRTKKYGPKVIGAITGLGKKAQGAQGAASQAAANAAAAGQRREGRGGTHMSRSRDRGGLGISQSQAQAVSDANRAAGMSGWGLARGGRVSYFDGGLASLWPR